MSRTELRTRPGARMASAWVSWLAWYAPELGSAVLALFAALAIWWPFVLIAAGLVGRIAANELRTRGLLRLPRTTRRTNTSTDTSTDIDDEDLADVAEDVFGDQGDDENGEAAL